MSLERRKSLRNSLKRKSDSSQVMGAYKRKSLLLQHSRSLNIPIDELSQYSGLNWFLNIPDQVFSLTYLSENDTQNPESLEMLEDLKFGTWHAYLAGLLYNFSYQPAQRNSLEKAITSGLRARFQNSKVEMIYRTRVSRHKALSPTENDSEALNITVIGKTAAKEQVLYVGFLVSWCSTIKEQHPFLPVLFCRGNNTYRDLINNIISEKFDVVITRFVFTEEELRYLTTYCLLMLSENDGLYVTFTYRLQTGDTIDLGMSVEPLLKLWSKIRHDDGIDIDSDEVMLYHEALDLFYESTFGIKFGFASFQGIKVNKCFSIQANSQMWFKSRKVITVVLKYLTHLAIKKLQVKKLSTYLDEGNVDPDSSVVSH